MLNHFEKLPPDTPNAASASSGTKSRETEEVSKELKKMQDKGKKRGKVLHVDTTTTARNWRTCCKKWKCQHTSILPSKYPRLTKQSITEFKKVYNEGKQKSADLSEGIVMKSRGRPTLLPETLMKKTIDTITVLRLRGAPATSSVINAVAKEIVQAIDRTLLVENDGHLSLSKD